MHRSLVSELPNLECKQFWEESRGKEIKGAISKASLGSCYAMNGIRTSTSPIMSDAFSASAPESQELSKHAKFRELRTDPAVQDNRLIELLGRLRIEGAGRN